MLWIRNRRYTALDENSEIPEILTRAAKRWRKVYLRKQSLYHEIRQHGKDILNAETFLSSKENTQHGTVSVHQHCHNVAEASLRLNNTFRLGCNKRDLIRGALLHDYFLYDWHHSVHEESEKLHGFNHPKVALRNAMRDFELTDRQIDIIKKHMWPMTVVPPMTREAWVVTLADKYCSFRETVGLQKGYAVKGGKPMEEA